MRHLPALLAIASAFALVCPPASAAADPPDLTQEAMRQAAESFYSVGLDGSRVYPIAKASLKRDRMAIDLEGGTLVLAQPILGRMTGSCYSGRATLSLVPPSPTERASLKARTGSEEFKAEVNALYLRFNDSTVADLTSGVQPAADASALERCSKVFSSRNDVVRKYEEGTIGIPFNLEMDLLEGVLSPALDRAFFLLEAEVQGQGWVTYLQRPGRGYEVSLVRLKPVGSLFDPEHWLAYDRPPDPRLSGSRGLSTDIVHNEMEIVIPNRSEFTIDALLTCKAPLESRSARFSMINSYGGSTWDDSYGKPVSIDGVLGKDGTPLPFIHRRHELLVAFASPAPAGREQRLRVRATEKTIWQITPESYGLLNTYPWFPQETVYLGGAYTFDWTVRVMRPLKLAGSGATVREWEEKDRKFNCAQWKSDTPVFFPSLIFGQFKETRGEYKHRTDGKPVSVRLHWLQSITFTDTSGDDVPRAEVYNVPLAKPGQIVKDAAVVLDFYEQVLGPYPNDELDVAMMGPGMWFGQAPPGLVQITAEYFLSSGLIHSAFDTDVTLADFMQTVLAHEIAHHYWGDVVSWKSDQDEWLSESLAEYSAGLFLQASAGDKAFRQKRGSWRKVAERWEGTLPIIHASRASGETAGDVRTALLYNKGPLILHMLRAQVGDEKFLKILKKILEDNRGRSIGTPDFQAATEAVAGYKMDWFFDQWVRGTGIPELRFSYSVDPAPGGKFLLKARLAQADRAKPKAFFVPLVFQFSGERRGQKEWRVKGADETLQLMLPEKPIKVMIDEPGDLLAKIVYESGG